jgi:molybdenum cofactor cytidylyltransferase
MLEKVREFLPLTSASAHALHVSCESVKARVEGIILAAGKSTRMGRPKLELEVGTIAMIARVVRAALDSPLDRVVLVRGPAATNLAKALGDMARDHRLCLVVNERPERGMASSLAAGIVAVGSGTAGAMILLGDQPFITAAVIDELVRYFQRDTRSIVVPLVSGRRSNPVLFPSCLFGALTEVRGDVGGRYVLQRNSERIVEVEMGSSYDDSDVDTEGDLQRVREKLAIVHRGYDEDAGK